MACNKITFSEATIRSLLPQEKRYEVSKTLNHKTFQATQVYSRLNIEPVRDALNVVVGQFESFR